MGGGGSHTILMSSRFPLLSSSGLGVKLEAEYAKATDTRAEASQRPAGLTIKELV